MPIPLKVYYYLDTAVCSSTALHTRYCVVYAYRIALRYLYADVPTVTVTVTCIKQRTVRTRSRT